MLEIKAFYLFMVEGLWWKNKSMVVNDIIEQFIIINL